MRANQRLTSLDGLRGIAAVVVLIHHSLLTFPSFADAYYAMIGRRTLSLDWLLSYTPLHTFWAGEEAVYLFFVLSGTVLVLPVLRSPKKFSWLGYYPRRLVRLYVPLIAAVLFGAAIVFLVPRVDLVGGGAWINTRGGPYTPMGFAKDVTLLFGNSGIISPLWSLRWEVAFSLLLPIFVLLAVILKRIWWLKFVAVFAVMGVGAAVGSPYLFFLPMFAVGALLISEWDRFGKAAEVLNERRWAWPTVIVLAVILTSSKWTFLGMGASDTLVRVFGWVPVVGVAMLVVIGAFHAPSEQLLNTRAIACLGTLSFSLYLVHEPLIIAARLLTFPASPWLGLVISVPLAFLAAWLFARFIEQPAHRLSKWVGVRTESASRGSRERRQRTSEPRE